MSTNDFDPHKEARSFNGQPWMPWQAWQRINNEVDRLRAENAKLREDKARLDWLEGYLEHDFGMIGEPSVQSPGWELGRNLGEAYCIDGQGESLREVIDSALAALRPAAQEPHGEETKNL